MQTERHCDDREWKSCGNCRHWKVGAKAACGTRIANLGTCQLSAFHTFTTNAYRCVHWEKKEGEK